MRLLDDVIAISTAREADRRQRLRLLAARGLRERQVVGGTLIWTSPAGQTYVTTPGSALLFPSLDVPATMSGPAVSGATRPQCADGAAMMPERRRTRAQSRANDIAAERRRNRASRESARPPRLVANDEPPPF